jgi:hypothetical protein
MLYDVDVMFVTSQFVHVGAVLNTMTRQGSEMEMSFWYQPRFLLRYRLFLVIIIIQYIRMPNANAVPYVPTLAMLQGISSTHTTALPPHPSYRHLNINRPLLSNSSTIFVYQSGKRNHRYGHKTEQSISPP